MVKKLKSKKHVIHVNGKLNHMTTYHDHKGKIIHRIIHPLKLDFHIKDLLQVIIGATVLAIPVGLTEESWGLGQSLPMSNIFLLLFVSLAFISAFVYYNYYTTHMETHWDEYLKRALATYIVSFIVVTILLVIIQRAPWMTEPLLALKRTIIVTLPASMSAVVADVLK